MPQACSAKGHISLAISDALMSGLASGWVALARHGAGAAGGQEAAGIGGGSVAPSADRAPVRDVDPRDRSFRRDGQPSARCKAAPQGPARAATGSFTANHARNGVFHGQTIHLRTTMCTTQTWIGWGCKVGCDGWNLERTNRARAACYIAWAVLDAARRAVGGIATLGCAVLVRRRLVQHRMQGRHQRRAGDACRLLHVDRCRGLGAARRMVSRSSLLRLPFLGVLAALVGRRSGRLQRHDW